MQKTTFSISVTPLTRIPFERETVFTYLSEQKIPVGTVVRVPFGKKIVKGVVREDAVQQDTPSHREKSFALKKISSLLPETFTCRQLALAKWIARRYFTSFGKTLSLFPSHKKIRSSRLRATSPYSQTQKFSVQKISFTAAQKRALSKIRRSEKPVMLTGEPSSGKTELLIAYAEETIRQGKQVLFLFPEIALTPHIAQRLRLRLGDDAVHLFHSALPSSEKTRTKNHAATGTPCVIAGSYSALFLPFHTLGLVIIDESHDDGYKQSFRAPRFDARIVAKKLASLHAAKHIESSSTPGCASLYAVQKNASLAVAIGTSADKEKPPVNTPETLAVDMRLAHWKNKQKRLSPPILSDELRALLKETLQRNRQAILLTSRQGMHSFSLCSRCKNIFRCPKCERALVAQRSGHFMCLGNHFRTQAFPKCPHCGNLAFIGHGIGTQAVEEAVLSIFPSARVARADSQTFREKNLRDTLFDKMTSRKIDILVGTQMIAKGWDLSHLGCIGIIDTDTFFSFPDFSNDMRAAQLFFQARGRLGRIGNTEKGTLLLQTYHTERPALHFLKENAYQKFLEMEMETRESLNFPPFCALLRVFGKSKNEELLRKQALEVFSRLKGELSETIKLSRPAKSLQRPRPGIFCRHIIIKCSARAIPPSLRHTLETLPKNWYVDRDPLSLL